MIITLIQTTIFVVYITFLLIKFKRPLPSISDSWYKLKPFHLQWIFTLVMYALGSLMTFNGDSSSVWLFASGMGLIFVGGATQFLPRKGPVPIIHFTGAAIGIGAALLGLGIDYDAWYALSIFGGLSALFYIGALIWKWKDHIWWIEIIGVISILIGLFTI